LRSQEALQRGALTFPSIIGEGFESRPVDEDELHGECGHLTIEVLTTSA
jgi:hypothetical protein